MNTVKLSVSHVCRHAPDSATMHAIGVGVINGETKVDITNLVPEGQVQFADPAMAAPFLRAQWHRDGFLLVISRSDLPKAGSYTPVSTAALVYSVADYLADSQVAANQAETERIKAESPTHVLVAYVGPDRIMSSHRLAVNVRDNCYKGKDLSKDLVDAANVGDLRVLVID